MRLSGAYGQKTGIQVIVSGGRGPSDYDLWIKNGHTGTYDDYLDYVAQRVIAFAPGFKGDKGNPGGNAASVGALADLGTFNIPAGTTRIGLSGAIVEGDGGAHFRRALKVGETAANFVERKASADGRQWVHDDDRVADAHFGAVDVTLNPNCADAMEMADAVAIRRHKPTIVASVPTKRWTRTVTFNNQTVEGEMDAGFDSPMRLQYYPAAVVDLQAAFRFTGGQGTTVRGLYVVSNQQNTPTIVDSYAAGRINGAKLPGYTAFSSGLVAFFVDAPSSPYFHNCGSDASFKFGIYSVSTFGHVYQIRSHMRGWCAGFYPRVNSYDYRIVEGTIGGAFACVLAGNTSYPACGNGGVDLRVDAAHMGFATHLVYQCRDMANDVVNPAGTTGCQFRAYGPTSKEQVGEAILKMLPESTRNEIDDDAPYFSWGNTPYQIPDAMMAAMLNVSQAVAAKSKQRYAYDIGGCNIFRIKHPGGITGAGEYYPSPLYTQVANGAKVLRVQNFDLIGNAPLDLEAINLSFDIVTPPSYRDVRRPRADMDYQRRSERTIARGFSSGDNLLLDPVLRTAALGTANNVTIGSGGNWLVQAGSGANQLTLNRAAAFGGLPAIPRVMQEEVGSNPLLMQLVNSGGQDVVAQIAARGGSQASGSTDIGVRAACVYFWCVAASGNFNVRLAMQGGGFAYQVNYAGTGAWQKVGLVGYLGSDAGSILQLLQLVRGNAAVPLYMTPPMVSFDDVAPFNRYAGPAITGSLGLDDFTVSTADATWDYLPVTINGVARQIPVKK